MDQHEIVLAAFERSIRQAAGQLDEVANDSTDSPNWYASANSAIRSAILAVERHFGELAGDDGLIHEITVDDPRLIGAIERHESSLARLLLEMWKTRETIVAPDGEHVDRLRWLAGQLRRCANEEIAILYETFNQPPGID